MASSGARVRSLGTPGRAATVLLAATVGVFTPTPVLAQTATSTADSSDGYYASPPPVDTTMVPDDGNGQPDKTYKQSTGCVTRDLGATVSIQQKPWGQEYLQIEEAQRIARTVRGSAGGGVKVAVIDTGVTQHPFFQNRLESGGDYVLNDGPKPGLLDCDGHGTEVAGIIAANTPTAEMGFVGVAPDARIVSIRQSSQNYTEDTNTSTAAAPPPTTSSEIPPSTTGGGGTTSGQSASDGTASQQKSGRQQGDAAGTVDTLAQAVRRAADHPGVNVINMSVDNCRLANGGISTGEQRLQAAVRYAVDKGIVVVAAAGNVSDACKQNDQADPNKPQTIVTPPWFADDVLSVGAIDKDGSVASFSVNGPWVSVAAPGTEITSLDPVQNSRELANQTIENDQAQAIQGTSFAAPYVAGVAALVKARFPDLTARQIMNRIKVTAQHPGAAGGRDNFIGYGVVNPIAALTAIVPSEAGIPPATPEQLPSGLPPAAHKDWTPMIVALAGTGGGLVALLVTMFVMHTIRRRRPGYTPTSRKIA